MWYIHFEWAWARQSPALALNLGSPHSALHRSPHVPELGMVQAQHLGQHQEQTGPKQRRLSPSRVWQAGPNHLGQELDPEAVGPESC